jgi:CBS domain-containing protein
MHIATILKYKGTSVFTTVPSANVDQVLRMMSDNRIGAVVVVDSEMRPIGIVSERDVTSAVAREGRDLFQQRVEQLMTSEIGTCRMTDTHAQAMTHMSERRIRHLPVVDAEGRLGGIVSIGDMVKAQLDEAEMEVDAMRSVAASIR